MREPRVTVIMMFLDPGAFLAAAIDSVLTQSFDDLELVLVDDGSTDGSSEVARRAASGDRRVRYVEHPGHANLGMSRSRNAGLAQARGEFVTFLDADDTWLPDAVARQVGHLDLEPEAAAVVGASLEWRSWDETATAPDTVYDTGRAGLHRPPWPAVDLVEGRRLRAPSMNAVMVRREALEAVGGSEPSFTSLYEDQVLLFKLLLVRPVLFHRQVVDRYRQHPASAYARGLASGTDRIDGASPARAAFVAFAFDHLARGGLRALREEDRGAVLDGLRRVTVADRWNAGSWPRRVQAGLLRTVTGRLRRHLLHRVPSPLPRLLPDVPVSNQYGYDRGGPVDRRYIERFLGDHRTDVRGRAMEVGDAAYLRRFGDDRVERMDVVHVDDGHPDTTILADLVDAPQIPDASFDCIVFTQTLHLIHDVDAVIATLHRILRPGGVLLMTVPGLTPLTEQEGWEHHWSFTDRSVQRLLAGRFDDAVVHVYGNVATATGFLYGFGAHELPDEAYTATDRRYPVVIAARARRGVEPREEPSPTATSR